MTRTRSSSACVAVLVLLMAGTTVAQETTGALQGRVAAEDGTPVAGAVVEASGPLGRVTTASDDAGRYRFPRLAPGSYTVAASLEEILPVES